MAKRKQSHFNSIDPDDYLDARGQDLEMGVPYSLPTVASIPYYTLTSDSPDKTGRGWPATEVFSGLPILLTPEVSRSLVRLSKKEFTRRLEEILSRAVNYLGYVK